MLTAIRFVTNRMSRWLVGSLVVCVALALVAMHFFTPGATQAVGPQNSQPIQSGEPIQPIVGRTNLDPRKIELGRRLFADPRLSHDDTVSCTTCHNLKTGGTDRKARSIGIHGAVGVINAPTVFNSGLNFSEFWD